MSIVSAPEYDQENSQRLPILSDHQENLSELEIEGLEEIVP
jgi:hypothetical protein